MDGEDQEGKEGTVKKKNSKNATESVAREVQQRMEKTARANVNGWKKIFHRDGPVMAILADHLLVPSRTDCLTAFMCPI